MNIVVCVKQVPDTNEVKLDPVTGTLIRDGVPSIMNPDDKAGLEAALELKDANGAHITVVSMGPPQADDVLREALAMGDFSNRQSFRRRRYLGYFYNHRSCG